MCYLGQEEEGSKVTEAGSPEGVVLVSKNVMNNGAL